MAIRGWRMLRVGQLYAGKHDAPCLVGSTGYPWLRSRMYAECLAGVAAAPTARVGAGGVLSVSFSFTEEHTSPTPDFPTVAKLRQYRRRLARKHILGSTCNCGIYGVTELAQMAQWQEGAGPIIAAFQAWGAILEGDRAFRAEYAEIEALWLDKGGEITAMERYEIERRYKMPIQETLPDELKAFREKAKLREAAEREAMLALYTQIAATQIAATPVLSMTPPGGFAQMLAQQLPGPVPSPTMPVPPPAQAATEKPERKRRLFGLLGAAK